MATAAALKVLLIGTGGHARVCAEALRDDPSIEVVGAVSRDGSGVDALDVDILGTDHDLRSLTQSIGVTTVCVAIGDNHARDRITGEAVELELALADAVSRFAMVSRTATWDPGVQLLPGAVINAATHLGRCVIVNTNASVDHDCRLGDATHVAPGAAIAGNVTIGHRVLVGIGARILPGVTIGDDAVVGGGAVVVDDVPAGATVVGVPARPMLRRSAT